MRKNALECMHHFRLKYQKFSREGHSKSPSQNLPRYSPRARSPHISKCGYACGHVRWVCMPSLKSGCSPGHCRLTTCLVLLPWRKQASTRSVHRVCIDISTHRARKFMWKAAACPHICSGGSKILPSERGVLSSFPIYHSLLPFPRLPCQTFRT